MDAMAGKLYGPSCSALPILCRKIESSGPTAKDTEPLLLCDVVYRNSVGLYDNAVLECTAGALCGVAAQASEWRAARAWRAGVADGKTAADNAAPRLFFPRPTTPMQQC